MLLKKSEYKTRILFRRVLKISKGILKLKNKKIK